MKKLFFRLMLSFVSFAIPCSQAFSVPSEEEWRNVFLKIRDLHESRSIYYADRVLCMKEHESLLTLQDGWKRVAHSMGVEQTDKYRDIIKEYVPQNISITQNNLSSCLKLIEIDDKWISSKEGDYLYRATQLFMFLYESRTAYLEQRLQSMRKGYVFSSWPEDQVKFLDFNQETVARNTAVFQEYEKILVYLYPFVQDIYLSDTTRLQLRWDKDFQKKLTKKTNDLGHPSKALTTYISDEECMFPRRIYKEVIAQANATSNSKEKKRIHDALLKRPFLAVFFTKKITETEDTLRIASEWQLDEEVLKSIAPQNRRNLVLSQVRAIQPSEERYILSLLEAFERKTSEQKSTQPKPAVKLAVISTSTAQKPTHEKKLPEPNEAPSHSVSSIPAALTSNFVAKAEPSVVASPAEDEIASQTSQKSKERRERHKDREARKKEYEERNTTTSSTVSSKELATFPQIKFSQDMTLILRKIYGIEKVTCIHWADFTKAYKKLREVLDGVRDAEPLLKSGMMRKFFGGILQEGKKNKPRSFNIHEPHASDGHMLGIGALQRIRSKFIEVFGWTLEKMDLGC